MVWVVCVVVFWVFCGGVVCCCGVGVVGGGFCGVFGGLLESVSPPPCGEELTLRLACLEPCRRC